MAVRPNLAQIDIWQKGNTHPKDSAYMRYRFSHQTEAGNYDIWRINGMYDETRPNRNEFTQVRRVAIGEWETAIRQSGKPDLMGGAIHGDEIMSNGALLIDGFNTETNPVDTRYYRARKVEFRQVSTLYEVGTSLGNPLATVTKRWEWFDGEFHLSQRTEWLAAITVDAGYQAMFPIERVQYNDTGVEITNGAMREPLWPVINVGSAGHATPDTNAGYIKIWGATNGYAGEVEILKGWDKPNRRSTIEDAAEYNKFRFDVCGSGYATTVGEVWDTKARYRVMKRVAGVGTV